MKNEIDLNSGFLIAPAALPAKPILSGDPAGMARRLRIPLRKRATRTTSGATDVAGHDSTPLGDQSGREIAVSFTADASKLYAACHALVNLADVAGEVSVSASATVASGYDKARLENWRLRAASGTRADRRGRQVKQFTAERPLPRMLGR